MVIAALCGAALGWLLMSVFVVTDSFMPVLPWSLPAILGLVAVAIWMYARQLRAKVADPHREVPPTEGLVSVALSKAVILTGAALVGACLVYMAHFVGQLSVPYPRQRVVRGGVTAVVCALLAWAGWRLESACRVPHDGDEAT
nr:DUF3180 domain-containing protein [Acidipropionibacterium virtanenii]